MGNSIMNSKLHHFTLGTQLGSFERLAFNFICSHSAIFGLKGEVLKRLPLSTRPNGPHGQMFRSFDRCPCFYTGIEEPQCPKPLSVNPLLNELLNHKGVNFSKHENPSPYLAEAKFRYGSANHLDSRPNC